MTAVNDGRAVWLAGAKQVRGMVQLGWRWLWEGTEVPETSGRQALAYDVFPGQSYAFTASLTPPHRAGDYVLELGLVMVDVYLALVWPDGQVSFWNGDKLFVGPQDPWVPLVKGIRLVKGVRLTEYPFLTLKSGGLPSGRYTGYLILTEANTCQAIAQARTSFLLETGEQAHENK